MSSELEPNSSHNLLAIVFCFYTLDSPNVNCSVKNITTGFIRGDCFNNKDGDVLVAVIPNSILSIKDGDDIEITADEDISCGLHVLYETETTIVNVKHKKRSHPSNNDLESIKNWLSLGSTTVIVEEERCYPSVSDLECKLNSLSLGSNTVSVNEKSSYPFKRLKHLR